ncbi:MAG TPA: tetratricopeptide repeat protein [Myxococcaceae bacterium]|nr:tetratricopeptide repeat protein [Myxococcaceae bacterium]
MRIVCQKCSATYEMDERLMGVRGVRGQCPNCKHQQTVYPDGAGAAPPPKPGGLGEALGAGARPRTTPGRGTPSGTSLDTSAPPAPRRATPPPNDPFAALDDGPPKPARATSKPHGTPTASSAPRNSQPGLPKPPTYDTRQGVAMSVRRGLPTWFKPVAIAAGVLVVLGGAAFGAVTAARRAKESETPKAILDVLPRWRLEFTDLKGSSAKELLAEGRKRLKEDRPAAYRDAEEDFQRAFLLDPRSDEAIAGYGLALALGRGSMVDDDTRREALALEEAARQRGGETVEELLAEVHLLLAKNPSGDDLQVARQLAQRALALASDREKGDAYLAIGRSYVATSGQLAVHNFDQALKSALAPPRTHYYRGLAHASVGEFREAIADLEKRLELDPGQPEALAALAGIYEELGSPEHARSVYLRAQKLDPDDARIPVQLAVLQYQFEGKAREAAAALRAVLKDEDRLEREVALDAYVHLASAERGAGNLDGAAAAGSRALTISKDDAAAHLQLLLVALLRGHPDEATAHLPFLRGHLDDLALEHVVAGKVAMAQGRFAEAAREYAAAAEQDERRVDAMLGAGVAWARAKKKSDALAALFKAVQADPTRSAPRRPVTRFWLADGETLEGLDGTVAGLSTGPADVMPLVYEGLIRFHQGAIADADRFFARVVEEDLKNALAFSFRALCALDRGDSGRALAFAQKASLNGARMGVSHYAFGMALAARGEVDEAKKQLRDASTFSPNVLASEVRLAELEARKPGEVQAARDRLVRCLALDPSYVAAKRALYALEQREKREEKP